MATQTRFGGPPPTPWLVLLYLSGTSDGQVTDNTKILRDLEAATRGKPLDAICLYQFSLTTGTTWGTILDDGAEHVLQRSTEQVDIADPRSLTQFIDWALDRTPVPSDEPRRVALFLKDDGTGWTPDGQIKAAAAAAQEAKPGPLGILFNGVRYMTVPGLRQAVQDSRLRKVSVYGLDGCQMGTVEVAYELAQVAKVLIADDTTAQKTGFAYDEFLAWLRQEAISPDPASAARKVVELTNARYASSSPVVGVRLEKVAALANAIDGLARVLNAVDPKPLVQAIPPGLPDGTQVVTAVLAAVEKLPGVAPAVAVVRDAFEGFYVSVVGGNGLTIFIPLQGSDYITLYGSLAFGQRFSPSTQRPTWSQFLAQLNVRLLAPPPSGA